MIFFTEYFLHTCVCGKENEVGNNVDVTKVNCCKCGKKLFKKKKKKK